PDGDSQAASSQFRSLAPCFSSSSSPPLARELALGHPIHRSRPPRSRAHLSFFEPTLLLALCKQGLRLSALYRIKPFRSSPSFLAACTRAGVLPRDEASPVIPSR